MWRYAAYVTKKGCRVLAGEEAKRQNQLQQHWQNRVAVEEGLKLAA